MESLDWVYDDRLGWKAIELAEQAKQEIEKSVQTKSLDEHRKLKLFETYLTKISKIQY
jgi:hypothetical protein